MIKTEFFPGTTRIEWLLSEVIQRIVETKSYLLIKETRIDKDGNRKYLVRTDATVFMATEAQELCDEEPDNEGFVLLDLFTAQYLLAVYNGLQKPENKLLFDRLSLERNVEFAFKQVQ